MKLPKDIPIVLKNPSKGGNYSDDKFSNPLTTALTNPPNLGYQYESHMQSAQLILGDIKEWIIDNYKKVDDWSKFTCRVNCRKTGNSTTFAPPNAEIKGTCYNRDKALLVSITLDTTDDSISLTINGKHYLWVEDYICLQVYYYILEKLLKTKKNDS